MDGWMDDVLDTVHVRITALGSQKQIIAPASMQVCNLTKPET